MIATGNFARETEDVYDIDASDANDFYGYSFKLGVSGWVIAFLMSVVGFFVDLRNIK